MADADPTPPHETAPAAPTRETPGDVPPPPPVEAAPPAPEGPRPPPARRRVDRWAHRRGEPRVFAFLWTLFLLGATTVGFISVGLGGPVTLDVYRPTARLLLVTCALGMTVLWPMTRLTQTLPPGATGAALKDLMVVVLPFQAVLWPQVWLAAWPWGVIATLDAVLVAWGVLTAGWLACATVAVSRRETAGGPATGNSPAARAAWMLGGIGLVLAGPLVLMLIARPPTVLRMFSPLTAVFELTQERAWTGAWGPVTRSHLWPGALALLAGLVLLAGAAVRENKGRGRSGAAGLHS